MLEENLEEVEIKKEGKEKEEEFVEEKEEEEPKEEDTKEMEEEEDTKKKEMGKEKIEEPPKKKKKGLLEKLKKKSKDKEDIEEKEKTEEELKQEEAKKKEEELKKKYGVTEKIPKQKLKYEDEIEEKLGSEDMGSGDGSLTDLMLKTEKLEGKFDIISGYKDDFNERIAQMSEEIGELRSMILETERSFGKVEKDFEEIRGVVGDIEPLKVKKGFEKKEQEIMENVVKIEKLENLVKALEKEFQQSREIMEKVKSFDNLVDISKKINEKINRIEDVKKYSDRTAAKVETIFSEITDKVNELQGQKEKIGKLDELTTEITQMLDEMSIKMKNTVDTKDLKQFKAEVEGKIQKLGTSKEKIDEVNKLIKETNVDDKLEKMKKMVGKVDEIEQKLKKFDSKLPELPQEVHLKIEKIKKIIEKQNNVISDLINNMEKVKNIPDINVKELNNLGLSLRFYQLLNILPFLEDRVKLKDYSEEMKDIIRKMRETGTWDVRKEKFMNDLLKVSKKISVPTHQEEFFDKMTKITAWTSAITDELQDIKKNEANLQKDLEYIKESLGEKVNSNEVEDVYIVERELMDLTGKFDKLKSVTERQNVIVDDVLKRISKVESEKIEKLRKSIGKLREVVKSQNFIINDLMGKVKEREVEIDKDEIKDLKHTTRFYQLLNMLPYVIEPSRVKAYLMELKELIEFLKSNEKWDPEKERFMKNFLSSLSDNYKSRGYEEIGSAYGEII